MENDTSESRQKAMDILAGLDSKLRKGFRLSSEVETVRLPTPSLGLTKALGGGWAHGHHVVTHGPSGSGKTTLMLLQMATAQRLGKSCALFDVEGAYEPEWAAKLGVDTEAVIYDNTKSVSEFVDKAVLLIEQGTDVLFVDSIAALVPGSYLDDGELKPFNNTNQLGALASAMSKALSMLMAAIKDNDSKSLLYLITQTRKAPISSQHWGDKPVGGEAITFHPHQIVKLNTSASLNNLIMGQVQQGDRLIERPIGREINYTVMKNRAADTGGIQGKYKLYYAGDFLGIDTVDELITEAVEQGVIQKAGAWYAFDGENIGNGIIKTALRLREDQALFDRILGEME
jgi:recombination protein RecA